MNAMVWYYNNSQEQNEKNNWNNVIKFIHHVKYHSILKHVIFPTYDFSFFWWLTIFYEDEV